MYSVWPPSPQPDVVPTSLSADISLTGPFGPVLFSEFDTSKANRLLKCHQTSGRTCPKLSSISFSLTSFFLLSFLSRLTVSLGPPSRKPEPSDSSCTPHSPHPAGNWNCRFCLRNVFGRCLSLSVFVALPELRLRYLLPGRWRGFSPAPPGGGLPPFPSALLKYTLQSKRDPCGAPVAYRRLELLPGIKSTPRRVTLAVSPGARGP